MLDSDVRWIQHLALCVDTICDYMFTFDVAPRASANRWQPEIDLETGDVGNRTQVFMTSAVTLHGSGGFDVLYVGGELHIGADDRMRLVDLRISCSDPDATDITSTLLRELELSKIVQAAKTAVARRAEEHLRAVSTGDIPDAIKADAEKLLRARIKAVSRRPSPRGAARGLGDAHYRRVALDLIELVESGKPTPNGVLVTLARLEAARLHRPVDVQTVRTWIRIARDRRFLAPGERGRLLVAPGPRLYDLEEGASDG